MEQTDRQGDEEEEEVIRPKKSTYWDVPLTSFVRQAKGHAFYQLSGVAVPTMETPKAPKKSSAQPKISRKTTKKKSNPQDAETSSDDAPEQDEGYSSIKKNIIVGRPKKVVTADNVPICTCSFQPGMEKGGGCGADCINRMVMIECHPRYCPLSQYCTNQRFQKREYPKLHRFKTEKKGWGIMVDEDVPAGAFIIEYVGEVISNDECNYRLERANKQKNFYFLTMDANECIDATKKGNLARFINHSCNPNCQTQKWLVNSEIRVGIFAQKNLKAGTELTFDYQFERLGAKKQVCYCGEKTCRGYLGAKKQKDEPKSRKKSKSKAKKDLKPKVKGKSKQQRRRSAKFESEEENTGDEDQESEEAEESSKKVVKKKPAGAQMRKPKKNTPAPHVFDFMAMLRSVEEAVKSSSRAPQLLSTEAPSNNLEARLQAVRAKPTVFLRRNVRRGIDYHKKLIAELLEQSNQARSRLETPNIPLEKLIRRNLKEIGMLEQRRRKDERDPAIAEPLPPVSEIGSGAVSFEAVNSSLAAPSSNTTSSPPSAETNLTAPVVLLDGALIAPTTSDQAPAAVITAATNGQSAAQDSDEKPTPMDVDSKPPPAGTPHT